MQDEVRYLGIEVGMGRRRPNPPTVVFARRYGDCKDKATLLVSILRAAKIVAHPALVSSTHGLTLDESSPSPNRFDHVIVQADLDGETLWLDPTLLLQGGGVARFRYSQYDEALVLDSQTETLVHLSRPPADSPSPSIHDRFTLPLPGAHEEARLDTERTYERAGADAIRTALRVQTPEQFTKEILKIYQVDYPGIHEIAPLARTDDRGKNVVRVVGHFAIPDFWGWREREGLYAATISARSLSWALARPTTATRSSPLAVFYPFHAAHVVDVDLPFDLSFSPERMDAKSPGLTLAFSSDYRERRLRYTYDLLTAAHSVAASDLSSHAASVEKATEYMARSLTFRPALQDGPHWLAVVLAAILVGFCGWLASRAYRLSTKSATPRPEAGPPWQIGGWLILLGLNVAFAPLTIAYQSSRGFRILFSVAKWHALTTPHLTQHPGLVGLLIGEVVCQVALTAYACTVAATFLKRKRSFPWHFQVFSIGLAGFHMTDFVLARALSVESQAGTMATAVRLAIWAAVWIAYVRKSKRVALTFVA